MCSGSKSRRKASRWCAGTESGGSNVRARGAATGASDAASSSRSSLPADGSRECMERTPSPRGRSGSGEARDRRAILYPGAEMRSVGEMPEAPRGKARVRGAASASSMHQGHVAATPGT
jgi:hypothetical protein